MCGAAAVTLPRSTTRQEGSPSETVGADCDPPNEAVIPQGAMKRHRAGNKARGSPRDENEGHREGTGGDRLWALQSKPGVKNVPALDKQRPTPSVGDTERAQTRTGPGPVSMFPVAGPSYAQPDRKGRTYE